MSKAVSLFALPSCNQLYFATVPAVFCNPAIQPVYILLYCILTIVLPNHKDTQENIKRTTKQKQKGARTDLGP